MVLMNNLVGKTIYNNGSYVPNQGTNDPTGYINRSVRQQGNQGIYGGVSTFGNDGQSDTRSGLAASALQRSIYAKDPAPIKQRQSITTPTALPSNLPQVTVSALGELKLPFNFKYAENTLNEKKQADAAILKLQQQRQQELREYMTNLTNAGRDYDDQRLRSLNQAASGGTAFSSAYGKRIGDDATNYNNLLSELQARESESGQQATAQRAAINDAFKSALSLYANQAGFELDQKAGTWNLKKKPAKKKKAAPKKKKK